MPDLPGNLRLLRYSIYVGGSAAILGLLAAACLPSYSPAAVWIGVTAALAVPGGTLGVPVLRALDRQRSR